MTPNQPMLCQQCGSAPCEPVCRVCHVHSQSEQLNLQVYNRCVVRAIARITVRTSAFLHWRDYERPEPLPNQLNPDVTVRRRGVMEKCTFCIQAHSSGEDKARAEGREIVGRWHSPLLVHKPARECDHLWPCGQSRKPGFATRTYHGHGVKHLENLARSERDLLEGRLGMYEKKPPTEKAHAGHQERTEEHLRDQHLMLDPLRAAR